MNQVQLIHRRTRRDETNKFVVIKCRAIFNTCWRLALLYEYMTLEQGRANFIGEGQV
jgi:hypothetical protein